LEKYPKGVYYKQYYTTGAKKTQIFSSIGYSSAITD